MDAYRCDRCGKYYDDATGMQILMKNRVIGLPDDMLDLCPECTRAVEQWLFMAAYNEKARPEKVKEIEKAMTQMLNRRD